MVLVDADKDMTRQWFPESQVIVMAHGESSKSRELRVKMNRHFSPLPDADFDRDLMDFDF